MSTLPAHAALFSRPDVWMEGDATLQLAAVAGLPGCVRAAGMPDLHPGRGFPIGAVVATRGVVYPHLVGGDAGCGVRVVVTTIDRASPDALERRIERGWDAPLADVDPAALLAAAWTAGPRGLTALDLPAALHHLAARDPDDDGLPPSGDVPACLDPAAALGTIGGGNHFAEFGRAGRPLDAAAADDLGLHRGAIVALVHTGSRGLGAALAARWGAAPLAGVDRDRYLGELAGAVRFARTNRLLLAYRLLLALGAHRPSDLAGTFDVTHNDVRPELVDGEAAWIHRKGAAPAYAARPTVVLGSRGAPSWLMTGAGAEAGLRSVAHGAGRKLTRGEARAKLRDRHRRADLARSPGGGRVLCDDPDLLYEEHPDAYKPIAPIIAALEDHGLATRLAEVTPILTVKR